MLIFAIVNIIIDITVNIIMSKYRLSNANVNISRNMVKNSLKINTNGLNEAIQRLTTGFKVNHASDNAANATSPSP